jgi:hypothetical protein
MVSFTTRPLYLREDLPPSGTRCVGGWVGPITGPDDEECRKILPFLVLELRPLGRAACSQALSRLADVAVKFQFKSYVYLVR